MLSVVLSSKTIKITELTAETTKQKLVEQSLRDYTGTLASERDVALKQLQDLKIQVSEWQLKYYKCKRTDDHDCEKEISRIYLINTPDNEQGRILADNAIRYASSKATRKGLVVQQPPN